MREPKYADVPAARHMRVPGVDAGQEPAGGLADPGQSGPVRPPDALRPEHDSAYHRKRFMVGSLTALVFISVPALIVLLVLFG